MTLNEDDNLECCNISNAIDNSILMHRDAHFGGSFPIMIDYYEKEGKGVNQDFELKRIRELAALEAKNHQNLAAMMLSGPEAEKVSQAKESYKNLRDLYDVKKPKSKIPLLIADLILSEEENPEKEIAAVVAEKGAIVPALIDILRFEDFYDPLFPGYGLAPELATRCLGQIGDKRAIYSLFETIGEADFFNEDAVLAALKRIGDPAKTFLLKVLHGRPLNFDNERAAIALVEFKEDPEVAKTCFDMLKEPDVRRDQVLSTYLLLVCAGLKDPQSRLEFQNLSDDPTFPKNLKLDVKAIVKTWS